MIKLISLDLDGTALNPEGQLSAAVKDAVAQARAAGVRVVFNTGRPAPEAFAFVREAKADSLVSTLGGAAVADCASGRLLRRWDVEEPWGTRAVEACMGRGLGLMVFAGDRILVEPEYKALLEKIYPYPEFHNSATVAEDILGYMAGHSLALTKIHGDGRPEQFPLEELSALEGLTLTSSNSHDFEVVGAGVDKGRSLALIASMYGIPLSQCAAVGDSGNDLAALRAAGLAIAMGNAASEVKAVSACVAPSNGEDGGAWAVLRCLEWPAMERDWPQKGGRG